MKYTITICLLFWISTLTAQIWEKQVSGTTEFLTSIAMPSPKSLYVVGTGGTILKTTDMGLSWVTQSSGTTEDLQAIYFISPDTGFVAGTLKASARQTTDGGVTWTAMTINPIVAPAHEFHFKDILFVSSDIGFASGAVFTGSSAVADSGRVYKTSNGGLTWTKVLENNNTYGNIRALYFTSPLVGYAAEFTGAIHRTFDGGDTWTTPVPSGVTFTHGHLFFTDPNTGVYTTNLGQIQRTTDAGASWFTTQSGITPALLHDVHFYDSNNGFTVTKDRWPSPTRGTILKTTDGGVSWTNTTLSTPATGFHGVKMIGDSLGIATGNNGEIYRYYQPRFIPVSDPSSICKFWDSLNSGTTKKLLDVTAVSESICYVSGIDGIILKTIDRGESWNELTSGTTEDLHSIYFTDPNTGYAVGNNYTLIKTTDGGDSWTGFTVAPNTGDDYSFNHIQFIDADIGFISGNINTINPTIADSGFVYKTIDGGATWSSSLKVAKTTTTNYGITSTSFASSQIGFASEYDGRIHKTIDGGLNWSTVGSGVINTPGELYFIDTSFGYYTTDQGKILQTTTGSSGWSVAQDNIPLNQLMGIDFYDALNGFAVSGDNSGVVGGIQRTKNGGNAWHNVLLPFSFPQLTQIDMFNENLGYAVGLNGTILKYDLCPPNDTLFIGVEEYATSSTTIQVSPNPFSEIGYIDLTAVELSGTVLIKILDASGRLVRHENIESRSGFTINREDLDSGIYFFSLMDRNGNAVGRGKFVIQ